jgi:C_GCAxxG_C_C family probable redox protein
MNSIADKAEAIFLEGFNCAQSVLASCGEPLGLDRRTALCMGEAFGGGMGRMGLTCGAVTGAFMAIGLKYAKLSPDDRRSREKSVGLVRRFRRAFEARHGSIACRDLLGCDISTPEGYQQATDRRLFREVCPKLVRDAAEIIGQLLLSSEEEGT